MATAGGNGKASRYADHTGVDLWRLADEYTDVRQHVAALGTSSCRSADQLHPNPFARLRQLEQFTPAKSGARSSDWHKH